MGPGKRFLLVLLLSIASFDIFLCSHTRKRKIRKITDDLSVAEDDAKIFVGKKPRVTPRKKDLENLVFENVENAENPIISSLPMRTPKLAIENRFDFDEIMFKEVGVDINLTTVRRVIDSEGFETEHEETSEVLSPQKCDQSAFNPALTSSSSLKSSSADLSFDDLKDIHKESNLDEETERTYPILSERNVEAFNQMQESDEVENEKDTDGGNSSPGTGSLASEISLSSLPADLTDSLLFNAPRPHCFNPSKKHHSYSDSDDGSFEYSIKSNPDLNFED